MAFVEALLLFVGMSGAQLNAAPLVGRATAVDGMLLPGVEIVIAGEGTESTVVTDEQGRFQVADLPPGTYSITATLPGFLTRRFSIQHPTAEPLNLRLPYAPLSEVLWVQLPPAEAYGQAVAIAHLRILETAEPKACEGAGVIESLHRAAVLRVFKGTLPDVIVLGQETAGRCWDGSAWREGLEEPYRVGQEYVIFLTSGRETYWRVSGPLLAFRVFDDHVALNGFAEIHHRVTLDELATLLDGLGQWALDRAAAHRRAAEYMHHETETWTSWCFPGLLEDGGPDIAVARLDAPDMLYLASPYRRSNAP